MNNLSLRFFGLLDSEANLCLSAISIYITLGCVIFTPSPWSCVAFFISTVNFAHQRETDWAREKFEAEQEEKHCKALMRSEEIRAVVNGELEMKVAALETSMNAVQLNLGFKLRP